MGVRATPGTRTVHSAGWRGTLGLAWRICGRDRGLWLLGLLGFLGRGGLLLLALPIMTVPSPVILSIVLRDQLGTAGPVVDPAVAVLVITVGLAALLLLSLWMTAVAEVRGFERVVADPLADHLRAGRPASALDARTRGALVTFVMTVRGLTLVPVVLVAIAVAGRVAEVTFREIIVPSSLEASLYGRVLGGALGPLIALLTTAVGAEVVAAAATRRVLLAASGLHPGAVAHRGAGGLAWEGARGVLAHPWRWLAATALAWLVTLVTAVPALVVLVVAATVTRELLMAPGGEPVLAPGGEPAARLVVGGLAVALLSTAWLGALALCGLGAAVRGALYTLVALR